MQTAHKTDDEKKEFFDSPEVLEEKITQLAEWVKASKHFVAFTGAGISTSAGIPDFRSGVNTVLPTGPGVWEKMAVGISKKKPAVKMGSAIPTPCHMALIKLEQAGYLKYLVSQNVDGLHRRSGFPANKIAEVHGNTNLEVCKNKKCKRKYMRDFKVRNAQKVHDHKTGRMCESCGKELYDSIINFGENLPEEELENGFAECGKADLTLALGSSLRVTPAADMPESTALKGGRLVIVNLQATPLDKHAFKINALIDDVLIGLMKKLELEIPPFRLQRRMMITKTDKDPKKPDAKASTAISIRGSDENGQCYSLFKSVNVTFAVTKEKVSKTVEPFRIVPLNSDINKGIAKIEGEFQGHYGESNIKLEIDLATLKLNVPVYYFMEFDLQKKEWINVKEITM